MPAIDYSNYFNYSNSIGKTNSSLRAEYAQKEQEVTIWNSNVENLSNESFNLSNNQSDLTANQTSANQTLISTQEAISNANTNLASAQNALADAMNTPVTEKTNPDGTVTTDSSERDKAIRIAESLLEAAQMELDRATAENEKAQEELDKISQEIEQTQQNIDKLKVQENDAKNNLDQANEELESIQEEINAAEEDTNTEDENNNENNPFNQQEKALTQEETEELKRDILQAMTEQNIDNGVSIETANAIKLAFQEIGVSEDLDENGIGHNTGEMLKYGGNPGDAWCASFVSWLYGEGQDNDNSDTFGYEIGVWELSQDAVNAGYYADKSEYTPVAGDIMIQGADHTGLVVKADDDYIYTIEGNAGDKVRAKKYQIDGQSYQKISGYVKMNEWNGSSTNPFTPNYLANNEYEDADIDLEQSTL